MVGTTDATVLLALIYFCSFIVHDVILTLEGSGFTIETFIDVQGNVLKHWSCHCFYV